MMRGALEAKLLAVVLLLHECLRPLNWNHAKSICSKTTHRALYSNSSYRCFLYFYVVPLFISYKFSNSTRSHCFIICFQLLLHFLLLVVVTFSTTRYCFFPSSLLPPIPVSPLHLHVAWRKWEQISLPIYPLKRRELNRRRCLFKSSFIVFFDRVDCFLWF